jgi:hypothetical protein
MRTKPILDESPARRPARFEIPAPGGWRGVIGWHVAFVLFVSLAIYHLLHYGDMPTYSVVAAVVFLGCSVLVLWGQLTYEGGMRTVCVNRMGHFSGDHFAEVVSDSDEPGDTLRIGFQLGQRTFHYLSIPCCSISSIEWATGQGSSFAGRDMGDWHVVIWYHDLSGTKRIDPDLRSEDLYILGPFGPRAEIEEFGNRFVEFLQASGVAIHPTEDTTEFTSTGKQKRLPRMGA